MRETIRHCLVTGASAGLGASLALRLARPGTTLTLVARRADALAQTAERCRGRGAIVEIRACDVADHPSIETFVSTLDTIRPIDAVIANAGIGGSAGRHETASDAARIFATNLTGAVATVAPLLPRMAARGGGRVALIASLAGLVPLPMAPAYSASKAGLIAWGEAQRRAWFGTGIDISIVCPGFVRTAMIEDLRFPAPFVWSSEKAADRIVRGFERGEARIAFPWPLRALIAATRLLPKPLAERVSAHPQPRGRSS